MKHWINKYIIMVCSCLLAWSCSDEELVQQSVVGKPVDVVLSFGATNNDQIEIKTRATCELYYESMVRNVYAFVFANEEKIYGHYFSADDLGQTNKKEYWTVSNMSSSNTGNQTNGTLHMSVPAVSDGGAEIVLIANIDLDFMNVSQQRLGMVRTKKDLNELVVSLNQEIPDRNAGYFMMTGSQTDVTISSQGVISVPNTPIKLRRLDAKVEVNVRVNPNEVSNKQKVKQFIPESWEVINLPKSSYLVPNNAALQLSEDSYYNIHPKNFETTENEAGNTGGVLYGFSFYTLENMRSGEKKKSVGGNYHHRDRRIKNPDGTYNNENGMWEYAPELATYLIIKGELEMVVDPGQTDEQHLIADVTYYVHLGDFVTNKDYYDVVRNTHYKYTINIKGVDNIELEVETSNDDTDGITENQPGAMGHLYEAEAETYTFDAHYGQRVYTIHANDVDTEHITWYVRTPFGREGIPLQDASGKEIYNDLDYKWVEFMLNEKPASGNYSNANQKYPADKSRLLTVVDVVSLIKKEVTAWRKGEESLVDNNGDLKFTVFVNEFYYEENPMNPNDPDILWKKFVNQPNRLMHILCNYNRSKDEDSSVTGGILTIRQRSIQTPYNINLAKTTLTTGWGCETVDEMKKEAWFYPGEDVDSDGTRPSDPSDNTSRTDGLYNTACLLNLVQGTGDNKNLNTGLRWDKFIDYNESEIKMVNTYKGGIYSPLFRNRDLDGDGIIDPNELRWYIASLDQLCGLFLGDQGLSGDAQLYPIAASREPNEKINDPNNPFNGVFPWRLHVVSSTASDGAGSVPTIVWAEEGASTNAYGNDKGKPGYVPIRCVRNLGMPVATPDNIKTPGDNYPPDPLVKVTKPSGTIDPNSVYRFDFTNMSEESRRYYTTRELPPGDEYSLMSRLYDGFETGALVNTGVTYDNANTGLKKVLEDGGTFATGPNAGYRVPNVREGVVMYLYCTDNNGSWWDNDTRVMVGSYYSFGKFGSPVYESDRYTWEIRSALVTINYKTSTKSVRLVKDWNPGTGQ